jgi:uncharacterized protein (DUF983 family)
VTSAGAAGGAATGRLAAIVRGLCPRCRAGRIFAGQVRMNEACPSCGMAFTREEGYFTGAMYISYILGAGVLLVFVIALALLLRGWPVQRLLIAASVLFAPLIPAIFRYSRILWIHLDRHFEP